MLSAQTIPLLIIAIETQPCKPLCVCMCRHWYVRMLLKGKDSLSSHVDEIEELTILRFLFVKITSENDKKDPSEERSHEETMFIFQK